MFRRRGRKIVAGPVEISRAELCEENKILAMRIKGLEMILDLDENNAAWAYHDLYDSVREFNDASVDMFRHRYGSRAATKAVRRRQDAIECLIKAVGRTRINRRSGSIAVKWPGDRDD